MKILIIEDERDVAQFLVDELKKLRPHIEIIARTSNIADSIHTIENNPDLDIIFSDIKIDDGMSFSIFEQVGTNAVVVFTTAYDEYALKAFDYNCADYLLKPISIEKLERTLAKCENRKSSLTPAQMQIMSSEIIRGEIGFRKRLIFERGGDLVIKNTDDLCYIFTEKGYVCAYFKDRHDFMINMTMSHLANSLNPSKFQRINRQAIINLDMVECIARFNGRDSLVKLKEPYSSVSFIITPETKKRLLSLL